MNEEIKDLKRAVCLIYAHLGRTAGLEELRELMEIIGRLQKPEKETLN